MTNRKTPPARTFQVKLTLQRAALAISLPATSNENIRYSY